MNCTPDGGDLWRRGGPLALHGEPHLGRSRHGHLDGCGPGERGRAGQLLGPPRGVEGDELAAGLPVAEGAVRVGDDVEVLAGRAAARRVEEEVEPVGRAGVQALGGNSIDISFLSQN